MAMELLRKLLHPQPQRPHNSPFGPSDKSSDNLLRHLVAYWQLDCICDTERHLRRSGRKVSLTSATLCPINTLTSISRSPKSFIQATTGGNSSLFHGVPDWVYEEEVFSNDYALWWSPDAQRVAYLTLDETKVEVFDYPIYNPSQNADDVHPYPEWVSMRYPKVSVCESAALLDRSSLFLTLQPGYDNPLVSVHVFSLEDYDTQFAKPASNSSTSAAKATQTLKWDTQLAPQDQIIFEVAWVGNQTLIVKEASRSGDVGSVIYFDIGASSFHGNGRVVRTIGQKGEEGDSGWIDSVSFRFFYLKKAAFPNLIVPFCRVKTSMRFRAQLSNPLLGNRLTLTSSLTRTDLLILHSSVLLIQASHDGSPAASGKLPVEYMALMSTKA